MRKLLFIIITVCLSFTNVNGQTFQSLLKQANNGNAEAQYKVGKAYYEGEGVKKSKTEAFKWYLEAAKQGHTEAQYQVGDCYRWCKGVNTSYEEALKWFRKAADKGHAKAMSEIGYLYGRGEGVPENTKEAQKWFFKAADKGDVDIMNNLAYWSQVGTYGMPISYTESLKWYQKAANLGDGRAMRGIGDLYAEGKAVIQSSSEAIKWYEKAYSKGDDWAAKRIAELYLEGQGVVRSESEAAKWYAMYAKDDFDSAGDLAEMYEKGEGFTQSYTEAAKWYKKALDLAQEFEDEIEANPDKYDDYDWDLWLIIEDYESSYERCLEKAKTEKPKATYTTTTPTTSSSNQYGYTTPSYSNNSYSNATPTLGVSLAYVQKQWKYKGDGWTEKGAFWMDEDANFDHKVMHGVQLGVRWEPHFTSWFGLNTGLFWEYYVETSKTYDYSYGIFDEHCLYLPLHLQLSAKIADDCRLFVSGGLSLDCALTNNIEYYEEGDAYPYDEDKVEYGPDYEMERFNYSAEVNCGITYKMFQLRLGTSFGLRNMGSTNDYTVKQNKPFTLSMAIML